MCGSRLRCVFVALVLALNAVSAAAESLLLPVFAHNASGREGRLWSSELYLTNPGEQPVQVTLACFLAGYLVRPEPCSEFMPPTRVLPPRSSVVWRSADLEVDLGCAEEALGALLLRADGPVTISSRIVSQSATKRPAQSGGLLAGSGQEVAALPVADLPPAGLYLLPALALGDSHRDGRGFDTFIGFANPGPDPVLVSLDLGLEPGAVRLALDGAEVSLPYAAEIPGGSWRQWHLTLAPGDAAGRRALGLESVNLLIETYAPLAFYASVLDRSSGDARTVLPVALR